MYSTGKDERVIRTLPETVIWDTFLFTVFSKGTMQTFCNAASASFLIRSDICFSSNFWRRCIHLEVRVCDEFVILSEIAMTGTVARSISQMSSRGYIQVECCNITYSFLVSPVTFNLRNSSTPVSEGNAATCA